jgi:vacuole morphology and inheritance protein 14
MVPFTPRLLLCVLPNLAHHVAAIQSAARKTNKQLIQVIQSLPPPSELSTRQNTTDRSSLSGLSPLAPASPVPTTSTLTASRPNNATREATLPAKDPSDTPPSSATPTASTPVPGHRSRHSISQAESARVTSSQPPLADSTSTQPSRSESPISAVSVPHVQQSPEASLLQEKDKDMFDYQATVNALTIQFLSEHEETRVAALKWLIMLHQKAPKKVRQMKRMFICSNRPSLLDSCYG